MDSNNLSAGSGQGKFLNGFLLGAVIGGGIVFLLSSKKGKKLLRTLSEEGLDKVSDLLEEQEQIIDDKEDQSEQQEPLSKPSPEEEKETNEEAKHDQTTNKKPLIKRFFKGISRKH